MLRWTIETIIAWIFIIGVMMFFSPSRESVYFLPYVLCCMFGGVVGLTGTIAQYIEQKNKRN